MYTRIVVPSDGSQTAEAALPEAVAIARLVGAPIHLVHVINMDHASRYGAYGLSIEAAAYAKALEQEEIVMGEYLAGIKEEFASQNLSVSVEQRHGSVAREIVDVTLPGDLIVMASHGRSGMKRLLLGSVAEEVVRQATVPVLLIRARANANATTGDTRTVASAAHEDGSPHPITRPLDLAGHRNGR